MQILLNKDNVVIAKGNIEDLGGGNFKAQGSIFGSQFELTLLETDLPDEGIIPQRDKIINGVKVANANFENYLNEEKEKARQEVINQVREAEVMGTISDNARTKLLEKGIL